MAKLVGIVYKKTEKKPYHVSLAIWWLLVLLALVVVFGVLANKASGQSYDYGSADFSKRDAATESDAIACWDFATAYTRGDALSGLGDFETGVVGGGCTYCPTGFTCICNGGSDITQEESKIYKGSSSINQTLDAIPNVAGLYLTQSFAASTAYQMTFRYKGLIGGIEDFDIRLTDATGNDYNFDTDTWGAASTKHYTNIPLAWTTANLYILIDGTPRPNCTFQIVTVSAEDTIYFDDLKIRELRSVAPVSNTNLQTTVRVTGDPIFDRPNDKYSFHRTSGAWGIYCDGTDDYVSYPDTGDTFDVCSTGKNCRMSIACTFVPAKNQVGIVAGKKGAVTRSYYLMQGTTDAEFTTNDGAATTLSKAGVLIANTMNSLVATFRYVIDGALNPASLYANNETVATSAVMRPPASTADSTYLCGDDNTVWNGTIERCCVWQKELSAIEANKWINPYFLPSRYDNGFYVDTCTQAASHATCSWDKCRNGTPNACQAEDTGVMAIFDTKTELCPNNSFETRTIVLDDNPTWTGWTKILLGGGEVTAYRDDTRHGNLSARITSVFAGTGSLESDAIAVTPATAYYVELYAKTLSGTGQLFAELREWAGPGKTNLVNTTVWVGGVNVPGVWTRYPLAFTSNAATNVFSVYLVIPSDPVGSLLIDTISVKAGTYHTPWVHNSGVATTVYNLRDYRLHNPLADINSQTGIANYLGGFCASSWVYTDWDGNAAGAKRVLAVPATAGNQNAISVLHAPGEMDFIVYDSAGNPKYKYNTGINSTSWSANKWHYVEVCSNNAGTIAAHHYNTNNATWYNWTLDFGAGTGIQAGQSSQIHIGSYAGTALINGYIQYVTIGPYNAVYPNKSFNSGKPPKAAY